MMTIAASRCKALQGLLLVIACCMTSRASIAQSDEAKARRWRVMVIVQERHIDRPRIPDPAVETALSKALIDAGYKVVDQDRVREIRYAEVTDRIIQGGPSAVKEAIQLGRRFGADVLVTGEAFTQEETRENVVTDLGTVLRIRCRGRVELKGIRIDTGEKVYSDSIHKTGSPEATVELASKICLQQSAEGMSEGLLKKLDRLALSPNRHVELNVRGIVSIAVANELEKALAKVLGVQDIAPGDFDARTYKTEVQLNAVAVRDFAALLETAPALKRFKLHVESANGSKIVAYCK